MRGYYQDLEIFKKNIERKAQKRQYQDISELVYLPHLEYKDIKFLRLDTLELLIKNDSFLSEYMHEVPLNKHTKLNINGITWHFVRRKNGLYIASNKLNIQSEKHLFTDMIHNLAMYLINNTSYYPSKYNTKNGIARAFIDNLKAKFKCKYIEINKSIIITKLHFYLLTDKKYFDEKKTNVKYCNYTIDDTLIKTEYKTTLYSNARQTANRQNCLEAIYNVNARQEKRDIHKNNDIYKHEYRLGVNEIKNSFEGLTLVELLNFNNVIKTLQDMKLKQKNGAINRGLDMKIKEYYKQDIYKAIDSQKQTSLTPQQKAEIMELIDEKLKPIYRILDRYEKRFEKHEKRFEKLENNKVSTKLQDTLFNV